MSETAGLGRTKAISLHQRALRTRGRRLSLRANFSWTFVGRIVYAACQWGMLAALARLGDPAMVGEYAYGLAVTAPVFMFADLQLRAVQASDVRDEYGFAEYLSARLGMTALGLVAVAFLATSLGDTPTIRMVIMLLGVAKAFEAISDLFYGLYQKRERMDRIAIAYMIRGPLSLVTLAGVVWATGRLHAGVTAMAISWLALLLTYDVATAAWLGVGPLRIRPGNVVRLVWVTMPLGLAALARSLESNVPRYLIQHYWGESEVGFYSAAAYFTVAGAIVVSALARAVLPRLAAAFEQRDRAGLRRLLLLMGAASAGLGLVGVAIAALAGPLVLRVAYGQEYVAHSDTLLWAITGGSLHYVGSFVQIILTAARRLRVQMGLSILGIAVTALSGLLLVPVGGGLGGAKAYALGSLAAAGLGVVAVILTVRTMMQSQQTDLPLESVT